MVPPALADAVADAKDIADRGSPQLDRPTPATLIESGRYLRRMRAEYAARRTEPVAALTEHAPSTRVTGLAAGCRAVAHLPPGVSEHDLIRAAPA